MFAFSTDLYWGLGIGAAVLFLVPKAWTWVKTEVAAAVAEVKKVTSANGAAQIGTTVGTDLSKVVTAVDPKAIALAASVKADVANVVSNVLKSL